MTARHTDRSRPIPGPLAACAVCAVAGAILCLAAAHRYGFSADLDVRGLLRRPAPTITLVFGLSGLLVALRARPDRGKPVEPTRRPAALWRLRRRAVSTSGPPRHGEGATHSRVTG
ncbi:hypothetical protein OG948_17825 [Embleya sp. NBC_00888]|uniref:hypothetical protein n=1 Tax=Embleya sp. NBC_00888 TaxID=2975960 RepID=UPI0038684E60|nr:hypothetical protein OG948_17825 [Embleya sp. NBC_00888]